MAAILRTLGVNLALNHASFRRDVDKIDKRMKRMSQNTRRVANSMRASVGGIGAAFAGIAGVRVFQDSADAMVNLRNKMGATFETSQEVSTGMLNIKRIARESRADLDAVGTLYQRMAVSMKHMTASQEQVAAVTQVVTNTFLLSGTTAQEAANSARQFAQGLASGSLKGDEFRSVSENNVVLTQMLAEGLNMSVGSLKAFAAAGGLTAEVILPILEKNLDKTNKKVGAMTLTMGQGGTLIKNSFMVLLDNLNQRFGVVQKIGDGLKWIADNLGKLVLVTTVLVGPAVLGALLKGFAMMWVWTFQVAAQMGRLVKIMGLMLIRMVAVVGAFLIANAPIVAIVLGLGALATILYEVKDQLMNGIAVALDWVSEKWEKFLGWITPVTDKLKTMWGWLKKVGKIVADKSGLSDFKFYEAGPGANNLPGGGEWKAPKLFTDLLDKVRSLGGGDGASILESLKGSMTDFIDTVGLRAAEAIPGLADFWNILAGKTQDPDFMGQMSGIWDAAFGHAEAYRIYMSQTLPESLKKAWDDIGSVTKNTFNTMRESYKTVGDVLAGLGGKLKAFAMLNRALMIRQILLSQKTAIMNAWASAPFPANLPAVGLVTAQTALLLSDALKSNGAEMKGTGSNVGFQGQSHDGIDNIPTTGTYLLEKGERVVDSRLNKDLTGFLADSGGAQRTTNVTLQVSGVSDPDIVVEALASRRGELESMLRQIAADDARNYRGA